MSQFVYLDNSATTPVKPEVLSTMLPYLKEEFGNPSSIYKKANATEEAVRVAREQVAKALGAKSGEIFFTSGGSEADNWAIKGAALANSHKGKHIITSQIEHHAVLHTLEFLEKQGYSVTYLPVDAEGKVSVSDVKSALRDDTVLITIMMANNEIGTIQPIAEIAKIAKENKVLFHTDAVQAVGSLKVDVNELGVDMLSLSAHKFGGPKGVGALYIKSGTKVETLIHGGGQERGRRAGTENVAGIAGLGTAITLATENLDEKAARIKNMRDTLIDGVLKAVEAVGGEKPLLIAMFGGKLPMHTKYNIVDGLSAYSFGGLNMHTHAELVKGGMEENIWRATAKENEWIEAKNINMTVPLYPVGWDPSPRVDIPSPWATYDQVPYAKSPTAQELLECGTWFAEQIKTVDCLRDTFFGHILMFAWNEFEEGAWICPTYNEDLTINTDKVNAVSKLIKYWKENL